ncbi:MAG: erythromycin esterase family protein, partial [Planctomycetota bacterium]
ARRERLDGAIERISDGVHAKMVTVQRVMGRDAPMPASLDGLDLAVEYGRLADDLDALTAALGAPSGDDLGLATRAAASLAAFSRNLALETQAGFWSGPELFAESFTRRDRAGADNVLWVARELAPDERIVVWAHDAHVSKAHVSAAAMVGAPPEQSVGPRPGFGVPLGRHLADAMGDDVVSIGFVGSRSDALNRGPAGAPGVQASGEDRPVEGSLEQLCSEATDAAHLLVDLRAGELPFSICGPIDHAPVAMDDWSKAYDALFWSRVVLPSSE